MFCSSNKFMCLSLYTEESCAQVACTLNPSLPCLLLCTSGRGKAQWDTGHSALPLSRTVDSALGLLHKRWDWGGNEERTASQHSSVSFGTIQLHSFIITFPSDLRKRMRAPSVLRSGEKPGSSLAICLILRCQMTLVSMSNSRSIYLPARKLIKNPLETKKYCPNCCLFRRDTTFCILSFLKSYFSLAFLVEQSSSEVTH